jgi:hypothetical protein
MQYLLGADYMQWQCSDPTYHSFITPKIIINKIIELSKEHFHGLSDKVIWDMFAGIGCDAIRLSRHAGKVIATELKEKTFRDLARNAQSGNIELPGSCIEIYHADCCQMASGGPDCNIVYFDPPWGSTFKSGEPFDFKDVILDDGTPVLDLADSVSENHSMIIKAPFNCNSFEDLFQDRVTEIFTFTKQKLKFLIVKAANEIDY